MADAIKINNLFVSYSKADALNGITLEIKEGDFACIIGPNGGGKTTLLKAILGLLKCDSGEIEINSDSGLIGYVPQTADIDTKFPITAEETVMTAFLKRGLNPFKRFNKEDRQRALYYLSEMGIEALAKKQIGTLSGGEFQRLLLSRALALDSKILLLDEPTANVDAASRNQIFSLLKRQQEKGKTVITVTHDLSAAAEFGNRLICINQNLIYCGDMPEYSQINRILYGNLKESGDCDVQ